MPAKSFEAGIRPFRLEYVRESTFNQAPSNPAWNLFSDAVQSFEPGIDVDTEGQPALGNVYPVNHFTSTVNPTPSVEYHLQAKTSSGDTLITSGGSNNDALTDGLQRTTDNRLEESHTVVRRMEQDDLDASNTINGSTAKDTRQYVVYQGLLVDTATIEIDPSGAQPITVTIDYQGRRGEVHQIDQPGSSTEVAVTSTSSNDTSQDVTIENEGAGTSATLTLSGTSNVSSTATFADIDAVELSAETEGDVELYEWDATNSVLEDQLATLRGQNSHDHGQGDLGVPALGTGSHASSIGQNYESPQAVTLEKPSGTNLADEILSVEITVENNVSDDDTTTGPQPLVIASNGSAQADITVTGEKEYFSLIQEALQTTTENFITTLDESGEDIQLDTAATPDVGAAEEAQQGFKEIDATLDGQGVTISS